MEKKKFRPLAFLRKMKPPRAPINFETNYSKLFEVDFETKEK